MAVLFSCATGNWLTAGTWAIVDNTSYLNSETTVATPPSTAGATARSSTFTPGAITVDAVAIKIGTLSNTTGTLTANLYNSTGAADVAGTSVTINKADLNATLSASFDGGWIMFKFASPVTLIAATAYAVQLVASNTTGITVFVSTGTNWSRALRTTTTQAPAAGDDLIVAGEHTGTGTGNNLTVTMNESAATDYGSNTTVTVTPALAICKRGTLKFNDASAANPLLRLSGHAIVYNGGTLNIGTVATPIPRNSTAILEFDPTVDGDFGLNCRNGSTITMQGLSRTAGKNITACKLVANTAVNQSQTSAALSTNITIGSSSTHLDPSGTSLAGGFFDGTSFNPLGVASDTITNAIHRMGWQAPSITNTTQIFTVWIRRGTGTNNRYVRVQMGSTNTSPPTNGFYADFDLQAVTAGTCTAAGNGSASSANITAFGVGFICSITGIVSTGAVTPFSNIFACNAAGGVSYAGDATQNFIVNWSQIYNQGTQPTDLTVDTDTGWLANDVLAIASTTRTANECELVQLGANAGASTLTCALYPIYYHDGLSPVQAEVILVTRNVKVRSTSPSVMSYMFVDCPNAGTTSVDIDWTEFHYLGTGVTNKRGLEVSYGSTFGGSVNVQYSSFHDCEAGGLYFTANIASTTFSNNTMWHLAAVNGPACTINSGSAATNYVIDSNVLIHVSSGSGWNFGDIGGTITNNTVVGTQGNGFVLNEAAALGTVTGLTAHSTGGSGVQLGTPGITGPFNATCWRNFSFGISFSFASNDVIVDNAICFGNANNFSFPGGDVWLKSPTFNGDSVFNSTNGISMSSQGLAGTLLIDNGDFSTPSGIKIAHVSSDINVASSNINARIILRNTKLGATPEVANQLNLSNNGSISSQRNDRVAGNHKTWMRNGTIQTDATTYNTSAPSLLMTPTSTILKLESAPQFQGLKIAVNNGTTATVSCYVRKSASYNGNQPRLIQKTNPALGQNADVVLATFASGTGTWAQMSGTTSTATDDGAWEIVVDCDGTAGTVNVDDFTVS